MHIEDDNAVVSCVTTADDWPRRLLAAVLSVLIVSHALAGDGTAQWTSRKPGQRADLWSVIFSGERFVAVGADGIALVSETGTSWEPVDLSTSEAILDVTASEDMLFLVTRSQAILSAPSSGELTRTAFPAGLYVDQVAYGNGRFVGLRAYSDIPSENRTPASAVSTNGIHFEWTALNPSLLESGTFETEVAQIVFGANRFVAVTFQGALVSSADGKAWGRHVRYREPTFPGFLGLAFGEGVFVATGYEIVRGQSSSTVLPITWTSRDGINWTRHRQPDGLRTGAVGYGNGLFVMIVSNNGAVYTSADGIRWTQTARTVAGIQDVNFGRGSFVAAGAFGAIVQSDPVFRLKAPITPLSDAFPLAIASEPGASFRLQYSTDLKNWIDLGRWTNMLNAAPFVDSMAPKGLRFYRALTD